MGIKNLHTFLKKHCPSVYKTVPISKYKNKTLAIDLSIYVFKYKIVFSQRWLDAFLNLIAVFLENDIDLIIVYDTMAPPEKEMERKIRSEARAKLRMKLEIIKYNWEIMRCELPEIIDKMPMTDDIIFQHFLNKHLYPISKSQIEAEIKKIENSLVYIEEKEFNLTRDLFTACGVNFLNSEGEAESTCSALNQEGKVYGIITDDTDVLAYGNTRMIYKIDFETKSCIEINHVDILKEISFSKEMFLDFCIMCGTDYNKTIPRIGIEKSFKLIQDFLCIENLETHFPLIKFDVLNYRRIRQLFHYSFIHPPLIHYNIFNADKLREFCYLNNCQFNIDRIIFQKYLKDKKLKDKNVQKLQGL